METISNIAGAASKAIWGESQTDEPVSGEQGTGTKEQPFDQGNEEDGNAGAKSSTATGTAPPSKDNPISGTDSNQTASGPSEAQSKDVTGDPSSAPAPEAKHEGADKPREDPRKTKDGRPEMPHTDSEREALVQKGEFPHDPNDHSGEPLKVHDGSEKKKSEGEEGEAKDGKVREGVDQEGGAEHGSNKGTGEKHVKSSGLAADGGDFDATNPGAGAEATRLQEEKGIHKEKQTPGQPPAPSGGAEGEKAKVSKLQKIKDKLHIGSGKDLDK